MFATATGDDFILPHHSEKLHAAYAGDKNLVYFEGDHNSPRPDFFLNSVVIFFINTLQVSSLLRDDNKLTHVKLSPIEKLLYAPDIGPKKLMQDIARGAFYPSAQNILSMAGISGGDNGGDMDDFHVGHDGDDDRSTTINQANMTNSRPRVQQISQLHGGADDDFVHIQPDRVQYPQG